jgi:hypothetical protein
MTGATGAVLTGEEVVFCVDEVDTGGVSIFLDQQPAPMRRLARKSGRSAFII